MQAAGFVAHCPYEVGDKVNITLHGGIGIVGGPVTARSAEVTITDILAVHSVKRNVGLCVCAETPRKFPRPMVFARHTERLRRFVYRGYTFLLVHPAPCKYFTLKMLPLGYEVGDKVNITFQGGIGIVGGPVTARSAEVTITMPFCSYILHPASISRSKCCPWALFCLFLYCCLIFSTSIVISLACCHFRNSLSVSESVTKAHTHNPTFKGPYTAVVLSCLKRRGQEKTG